MVLPLPIGQFSLPGGMEMLIILIVALLLFGNRLPEVARSIGKSLNEFRRGMQGLEQELKSAINETPPPSPKPRRAENEEDRQTPIAPKFIPPSAPPEERIGE